MEAEEPVETLHPGKTKWVMVLLISAGFVAIGIHQLRSPGGSAEPLMAWGATGFFGAGVLLAIAKFLPQSSFLRLSPAGLTARVMWRDVFYRWSDIERFGVAPQSMIGLNFSATSPLREQARVLRRLNRALTG